MNRSCASSAVASVMSASAAAPMSRTRRISRTSSSACLESSPSSRANSLDGVSEPLAITRTAVPSSTSSRSGVAPSSIRTRSTTSAPSLAKSNRAASSFSAEARRPRIARLEEHGVDARQQLRGVPRLRDVVRRAAGETADLVHDLAARRQEDDRDVRDRAVALDAQAHVVAVGVRQHDVEQDEVGNDLAYEGETLAAVPSHGDLHAVGL